VKSLLVIDGANLHEQAAHLVFHLDGGTDDHIPEAQHPPQFPQFFRHYVAFRQQVDPKKVGYFFGVGPIVLLLCRRNRLEHRRVGNLQINGIRQKKVIHPAGKDR